MSIYIYVCMPLCMLLCIYVCMYACMYLVHQFVHGTWTWMPPNMTNVAEGSEHEERATGTNFCSQGRPCKPHADLPQEDLYVGTLLLTCEYVYVCIYTHAHTCILCIYTCAHDYHFHFEVCSKYMVLWLLMESGTTMLVNVEALAPAASSMASSCLHGGGCLQRGPQKRETKFRRGKARSMVNTLCPVAL